MTKVFLFPTKQGASQQVLNQISAAAQVSPVLLVTGKRKPEHTPPEPPPMAA